MSSDTYFDFVEKYIGMEEDPISYDVYGVDDNESKLIIKNFSNKLEQLPLNWIFFRINDNKFLFFKLETTKFLLENKDNHNIPWFSEKIPDIFIEKIKLYHEFNNYYSSKDINYCNVKSIFLDFLQDYSKILYPQLLLIRRLIKIDDVDDVFSDLHNITDYRSATTEHLEKHDKYTWIIRPSSIKDTKNKFARVISCVGDNKKIHHILILYVLGYGYVINKNIVVKHTKIDDIDYKDSLNIAFTNIIDLLLYVQSINFIKLNKFIKI